MNYTMRRETRDLEFKESISNTFLKTVSAFANYGDGRILFGVDDDGKVVGLPDLSQTCLDIENRINDSIFPVPDYRLEINKDQTITLWVYKGMNTPYLYKNKAYRRSDAASVEVDRLALNRLILTGNNQTFEDLPSQSDVLAFSVLEEHLEKQIGISKLNQDILKTLGLFTGAGQYTHAADLLADENSFPGIDIVRFGDSIDEIHERNRIEHISILTQYTDTLQYFRTQYQFERVVGAERRSIELIPEKAMREAVANSLVHRMWDIRASIHIGFFPNRIEITSPGGLPDGLSEDEYLYHRISVLRNPKLANVFFRLGYIENFGTGVQRIIDAYAESQAKPDFFITDNAVRITLPVLDAVPQMTQDELLVFKVLPENRLMSRKEIEEQTPFTRVKVIRVLNELVQKKAIRKTGVGRGTKYMRV